MKSINSITETPGRLAFGIDELARMIGVSKGFIRLEIERGRLKPLKIGKVSRGRVLITKGEIDRYLQGV